MTTVEGTPSEATRLRRASPLRQLLTRPEFGSIVGAILIFFVFWARTGFTVGTGFMSWRGFAAYIQVAAQIGILGATVPADDRRRVRLSTADGRSRGLILGLSITQYGLPLWLGLISRSPSHCRRRRERPHRSHGALVHRDLGSVHARERAGDDPPAQRPDDRLRVGGLRESALRRSTPPVHDRRTSRSSSCGGSASSPSPPGPVANQVRELIFAVGGSKPRATSASR
jgi:hypothetical protein